MMAYVVIKQIHLLHCFILVASVFLMLCMNTPALSSGSVLKPVHTNTTIMNRCIETERHALLQIKGGFVDINGYLSSWGSPQEEDCCQWSGVGCDTRIGHVTHLNLSYPRLTASNLSRALLELKNLKYLDLSWNNFTLLPIPIYIGSLENLVYLDLSNAFLGGAIPLELGNLSKLNYLDLSDKFLNSSLPKSIAFTSLTYLDFSNNRFTGAIPHEFGNLSKLHHLDLHENDGLDVSIFDWLSILSGSLVDLDLSHNKLGGNIPVSLANMTSLKSLRLSGNQLDGVFPTKYFRDLSSLQFIDFSYNNLSGNFEDILHVLPEECLQALLISQNKLTGSLPDITRFSFLRELNVGYNQLNGYLPKCFERNSVLQSLDSRYNNLSGSLPRFTGFSHLKYLNLGQNKFSGNLPNFTGLQSLRYLYLNNNEFSNKIRGELSSKLFDIHELDISFNNFEGLMPRISSRSSKINLSNNKFSGELFPLSAAKGMNLTFLDCSHNLLFGVLPSSWVNFHHLVYLNLGHNNFSGIIPMSIGYLTSLQTLILQNNSFSGGLPDSLGNCSNLGFADFGLNKLSGKIPDWIGVELPKLYALILRSNKFCGSIPYSLCHLSNLRFLDLSINKISGSVPQCFGNLTGMIKRTEITEHYYNSTYESPPYFDTALASWKGQELEYGRNFAYLKMICLSHNELTGKIPIGLTRLVDLKGLNLSRNKFNGEVPQEIGRLKMLECLDLSRNRFSGKIPESMSGLNFLGYLDLSNNNFSAKIPSGTQLLGFNISVYEGNGRLCGPPLKKICPGDEPDVEVQPSSDGNEADEDEIEYQRWLYIGAALGFSTTFWGICGTLVLNRHWRDAYFLFLNNLKDRVYGREHCQSAKVVPK